MLFSLTLYHTIPIFNALFKKPSPTMFSLLSKTNFNFTVTFILLSSNVFNLDQSKILSFGIELKNAQKSYHIEI